MIWHLASRAVYAAVTHKWEEVIPRLYAVLSINVKTSHFLWLPRVDESCCTSEAFYVFIYAYRYPVNEIFKNKIQSTHCQWNC